ncbi:hypothetical protein RL72_00808 [Microbacterium azadirachtae]|uniref:Uncharacterized protein n=1 Tax=Microbacterium azadirachtae TaxID=582680 RepID=A0A0F0L3H5_9MICO|nr:hypothetical protein RL72_00808 [Microbacterium azadirachtae]
MRVPEQRDGALVGHFHGPRGIRRVGAGDELVEEGEGVSRGSAAGAHDERQHALRDRHAFLCAELLDVLEHRRGRHQPERVVMGAGADRAQHLLGLRRGEDELDVRRRLFDELEQGVEALRRDHVRLVEDEDLEPVAAGREGGALAQVAGVVDAVVAGGVDLDDVEGSAAVAGELDAARADAAGGVGRPLGAVEAARQDARGRRLAAPARPREQIGVAHAVAAQRGHERIGHLRLPDHLPEVLGPVAAVQGCAHPTSLERARDIRTGSRAARRRGSSHPCRGAADGRTLEAEVGP